MRLGSIAPHVGFGTSGVRALVADLTPEVVWTYTRAFIEHLRRTGQSARSQCVLAWDLRPSSPDIAAAVAAALLHDGIAIDWAGPVPTPALALRAIQLGCPGIMVTGSHIPFDRNGIKFYTAQGEILKSDEVCMTELDVSALRPSTHALGGVSEVRERMSAVVRQSSEALLAYRDRYTTLMPAQALSGLRIGVYQHSAVGRDLLADLLGRLGASVVPLGRSDSFVPIDTEAVSVKDEALAAQWCAEHRLHAVASTDGDGDRPWVCDEKGRFIRGDVLGILTARWLGIRSVVTPVSSNTALEKSGWFERCARTRIGSPYVIEAMQALAAQGEQSIAGFEANGGFLLQTAQRGLQPLPTRDSTLPILAALALSQEKQLPLSSLPALLPARYTQADRLQNLPTARSQAFISQLRHTDQALQDFVAFTGSAAQHTDSTDGLRITLANGDIVHLRPSGNAPELRCYTESGSAEAAQALLVQTLQLLKTKLTA